MEHLTTFEIAMTIVMAIVFVKGFINFIKEIWL